MAKTMIDLAVTGKVIGDLTYSWCKKMSDSSTVSTSGSTLTERANGIYIIDNPNVTEDTDFRVYVTADSYKYAVGIFSPADGDIALASVCTETRLAELDAANLPTDIAAVKGDTAAILDDTGTSGVVLQPVERNYGHAGTAQAGSLSSITLAATASSISNIFIGQKISIYEGTGINQTRGVLSYNGTSKVLGVARSWEVAPDATSKYRIEYDFGPKVDSSLNVTTGTNLDKSSYVLASGNHTGAVIPTVTAITNDVGITQTGADKAWSTATRVLTAGTNIALAKGTGVTGFNDISTTDVATAVWNAATATYGTAGSYGLLVETNLDAAVSSKASQASVNDIPINPLLTNDSRLNNLDTTIGSRLASASYIAPDNSSITAIKLKTDNIQWGDITDIKDEALGKWVLDPDLNTLTLYRQDGVTILKTFSLTSTTQIVPAYIQRT